MRDDHASFLDGGNDMAKIQIIAAMTMDGFLPKADKDSIEFIRGLSRYNLIDEMVVYILPVIAGKGTPVFDDLTPSRWSVHKTTSFSNGITRIIYRNSCILQ